MLVKRKDIAGTTELKDILYMKRNMMRNKQTYKTENTSKHRKILLPPTGGEFTIIVVLHSPVTPLGRVARNASVYFLPTCRVLGLIARLNSLIGFETMFLNISLGISFNVDKLNGSTWLMSS